ncbi:hypothetical protein GCM10009796_09180 [Microbacterium koreense]
MLLLHDAAAVRELGQRLGQAPPETRAHARGENDGLKSHSLLLECEVHRRFTESTLLRAGFMVAVVSGSVHNA